MASIPIGNAEPAGCWRTWSGHSGAELQRRKFAMSEISVSSFCRVEIFL
jgi:hypothetical protein